MKRLHSPSFASSSFTELWTVLTHKQRMNSAMFFICFLCLKSVSKICITCCCATRVPLQNIPQVLWLILVRENVRGYKSWHCCGRRHCSAPDIRSPEELVLQKAGRLSLGVGLGCSPDFAVCLLHESCASVSLSVKWGIRIDVSSWEWMRSSKWKMFCRNVKENRKSLSIQHWLQWGLFAGSACLFFR